MKKMICVLALAALGLASWGSERGTKVPVQKEKIVVEMAQEVTPESELTYNPESPQPPKVLEFVQVMEKASKNPEGKAMLGQLFLRYRMR